MDSSNPEGSTLDAVLALHYAGISTIPCDRLTKQPIIHKFQKNAKWEPYQVRKPTREDLERWFQNGACIGAIGGPVSGNLEFIDFDEPGFMNAWAKLLKSWNCRDLLEKLVTEKSQRKGGWHVGYRHSGQPEGNKKLARRPPTAEEKEADPACREKCLIETRGNDGYCIIAPSPGYEIITGSWTDLPLITAEEREILLAAARTFDQMPITFERPRGESNGDRVGDDYNSRASIDEILVPLGWERSGDNYWRRPGKSIGHSATWDAKGDNCFHIFTSSCEADPGHYTLFTLYAKLHHGGDFGAAAKAALASGYGNPKPRVKSFNGYDHGKTINELPAQSDRKWFTYDEKESEEVQWLLEPYIPIGVGYTLLFGDSDMGKSTALLAIIASLSNGLHPFTKEKVEPVRSIVLSAEDSATFVVKPRLEKFGANMRNVMSPEEFNPDGTPNPMVLDEYGMEELYGQVVAFKAKIIVIDPLAAYFLGQKASSRQDARAWTKPITNMAIQAHCSPIIVAHVNKSPGLAARYRTADSQDFFDASRSALMTVRGDALTNDYALTHEKHNLSVQGDAIGYTFSKERGFEWTGASDLTAEDMQQAKPKDHVKPTERNACKGWILDQLQTGNMLSEDLAKGAKDMGFSFATMRDAKQELKKEGQIKNWKGLGAGGPWWSGIEDYSGTYRGGD